MGDPLSVASGVAGLLALTSAVISTSYKYGSSVIRGSQAIVNFINELKTIRATFEQLEDYILTADVSQGGTSREVRSSVAECSDFLRLLHGKLEKRQDAGGQGVRGVMNRLTWPLSEKDLLQDITTLARFRDSFSLAIGIDTM